MKTLIITALTLLSSLSFAQQVIEWVGGTPGKEQSWNEASNWSTNQVPDEYSIVVIKFKNTGHNAQPIIEQSVHVASIQIHSGALLTIDGGADLLIDGTYTFSEGLSNYGGKIDNAGIINLLNIGLSGRNDIYEMVAGSGHIQFNEYDFQPFRLYYKQA